MGEAWLGNEGGEAGATRCYRVQGTTERRLNVILSERKATGGEWVV